MLTGSHGRGHLAATQEDDGYDLSYGANNDANNVTDNDTDNVTDNDTDKTGTSSL